MPMLNAYNLLPDFYRLKDEELGYPLKKFLEPMQAVLDAIYEDEVILRTLQDPRITPAEFLRWIAISLAWEFISQDIDAQRNEALEIVNFYDLKGTPYAMRLISALILSPWFDRLIEYYDGHAASISKIKEPFASMDPGLKAAINGEGRFPDQEWYADQIKERGRPYDFSATNRRYHYFIKNDVPADSFEPGELRAAVLRFIEKYQRFHPAGRYAYLYFKTPSGEVPDGGALLIEELCGGLYWDLGWRYDDGYVFDAEADPVHPSVSWYFPRTMNTLDKGEAYDTGWVWDAGDLNAHVVIELN